VNDPGEWIQDAAREALVAAAEINLSKASIARVYDYVLGGKENFEIDRRAANRVLNTLPEAAQLARDNRNFLRRGVRFLVAEVGIRQIIDIGSGLPSAWNVHEVAQEINPEVRVAYVDNDPIGMTHGLAILGNNETTAVITADLLDPESIFEDPAVQRLINFDEPLAVLAAGILHHLSDEQDPVGVMTIIKDRLPGGSHLLASNFLDDDEPRARHSERAFLESGLGTGWFRTWDEQLRLFDGLEMVEPGLVYANDWRPDDLTPTDSPVHTLYAAGIGRKPR
jgi:hypothetical protein